MADLRKVYIDSCCFIDMAKTDVGKKLESDREEDVWYLKRLLEANRDNEVRLFTSSLTIAECTHVGDAGGVTSEVKDVFTRLLMSGQYVYLVQVTPFIATDARDLRWNGGLGIRGADAIHVASALAMGCEEMLSADSRLERVSKHGQYLAQRKLYLRSARETVCLPPKYKQIDMLEPSKGQH